MDSKKPDLGRPPDPVGPQGPLQRVLWGVEDGLCYFSLFCLALLPAAEVIIRLVLKTGIPDSSGYLVHLLLVMGLLSAMITTRSDEHLSIALVQYLPDSKIKQYLRVFTHCLSAFVVTIIAWSSVSFIRIGLIGRAIGFIPDKVFALIIPIGFGVIAFRFARLTPLKGKARVLPFLTLLLGSFCALPIIAKSIWSFDLPPFFYDLSDFLYAAAYYIRIPGAIILILSAFAGTPLFVVMGGLSLLLIQASWGEIDVVANQVYIALTQDSMIPIPLFTLVGFFLSESKAGERLVQTFRGLFSWLPGGMIIAAVIICAFFTSFTGASGVTILALGGILFSVLSEHTKYPEKFSIGLLTSSGSVGLLFPPSLPIILVGATTMTNIMHLFLGGIIPGLILVVAMIIFGISSSIKIKIPVTPFRLREALGGIKSSFFEIILPFLLIAGFFSGIFSLVEIAAVALIYIFIVEVLIHRDLTIRDVFRVLTKALPIIGGVLSIIALSMALSYYIVDSQAPDRLAQWMLHTVESKYIFLLLLNLALLVAGCLMDIFSAILIVLPLVAPLGQAYGIDPVHLGIIFITNLELGFLTPPVGLNLFLASYRFKKPFVEICRYVFPFLLIQLVVLILVTYVPWFSTYLTRFF
ncbi:trap dicarboxylate transporter- dctm subunit [Treponema primitia ZAS-2]|uniref:Trap dicarboxylate transporter-dctm subunit n=1 Tax=Treponema primitia (strain ATCC BAA-887 / DSM 12427 / ZAS-2) TaxID=545694 RepID=F5YMY3_TREPZ|nr:TRAP transporter large permease subunit [Treponema primitia]AEF85991.1 trap dicarboxylate transporter- dctm subunit [Treponema primitia ZAS-2]